MKNLYTIIALTALLGLFVPGPALAKNNDLSTPSITIVSIKDNKIRFSYEDFPKNAYVNLLWQNISGQDEAVAQVQLKKRKGTVSIKISDITPSGTFTLEGRTTKDVSWSVSSEEFALGGTSSPELNCTLTARPTSVKSSGTVTFAWKSIGANYLLWDQNQAANVLGLTGARLLGDGTEKVSAEDIKKQMLTVRMNMFRDDGTRGTCSTSIKIK